MGGFQDTSVSPLIPMVRVVYMSIAKQSHPCVGWIFMERKWTISHGHGLSKVVMSWVSLRRLTFDRTFLSFTSLCQRIKLTQDTVGREFTVSLFFCMAQNVQKDKTLGSKQYLLRHYVKVHAGTSSLEKNETNLDSNRVAEDRIIISMDLWNTVSNLYACIDRKSVV